MERNLDHDEVYVRYLLGDLPEDERVRLEEDYFADDASFARLLSAKNELIDLYARGELSGRTRERFEEHFLSTHPRRRHVHEAREFIESINVASASTAGGARVGVAATPAAGLMSSWWRSFAAPLRATSPALRFAFATLLLAVALGGVWALYNRFADGPREIAKRESEQSNPGSGPQTQANRNAGDGQPDATVDSGADRANRAAAAAAARDTEAGIRDNARGENFNRDSLARQTASPPAETAPAPRDKIKGPPAQSTRIASLLLTPVLVRDAGRANVLRLTPQARTVRLRLAFKGGEYNSFRAVLRTVEGEEIWRSGLLKTSPKTSNLNLTLPAARLRKSDYILTLSGASDGRGGMEEINDYYFKVERPAAP